MRQDHIHDNFKCPYHVRGCNCPSLDNFVCNPYHVDGYCPDYLNLVPEDVGTWRPDKSIVCADGERRGADLSIVPAE